MDRGRSIKACFERPWACWSMAIQSLVVAFTVVRKECGGLACSKSAASTCLVECERDASSMCAQDGENHDPTSA